MAFAAIILPILLGLLTIDAIIEVGFIGSMVGYLHQAHGDVPFQITTTKTTPQFGLYPKPANLLVNQGHTSNGAAGTALILVSWLGFLVLYLEKRGRKRSASVYSNVRAISDGQRSTQTRIPRKLLADFSWLYPTWIVFTVLSFLLTMSALICTFVVTQQTNSSHSQIDLGLAITTWQHRTGKVFPYQGDTWTPENWYKAVLGFEFMDKNQKDDVRTHVRLMEGWRWNLIPLFLLGLAIMIVAMTGWIDNRKRSNGIEGRNTEEKHISTVL